MATQPWLSVITPVYNGENYLSFALDSIVAQNDPDIECIVVDGESSDSTLAIVNRYRDKLPLKVFTRESKENWVSKTNYALSLATGKYVCFLHHDDLWLKNRLSVMRQLTEQFPEVTFLLHPSNFIDAGGQNMGLWSCPLPAAPKIIPSHLMRERLLVQNFISILAPVFKREAALAVGGLDVSLWYTADWDFWLKIAAQGDGLYYPKPLSEFRIHANSQTIVRSSYIHEFREQLEIVASKHLALWDASADAKRRVKQLAKFSVDVNVALAGTIHHAKPDYFNLALSFLSLGPFGWYRYLEDSRIWQRSFARVKTRLASSPKQD